jgi:spoIIIJ-associated protein
MEAKVSEILENILSLLSLEGSFEVEEKEEGIFVFIETEDAGKLIGHQGETLSSLQLIVNLILSKQLQSEDQEPSKRVIIDVSGWKQSKEEEIAHRARGWAQKVLDTSSSMELDPMPSWQRRIVHMTVQGTPGVKSESVGVGLDRHLVISLDNGEVATDISPEEGDVAKSDTQNTSNSPQTEVEE